MQKNLDTQLSDLVRIVGDDIESLSLGILIQDVLNICRQRINELITSSEIQQEACTMIDHLEKQLATYQDSQSDNPAERDHIVFRDVPRMIKGIGQEKKREQPHLNISSIHANSDTTVNDIVKDLDFPSPMVAFKGGVARTALKQVLLNTTQESETTNMLRALLPSEYPLADTDIVVPYTEDDGFCIAKKLDALPDGIEYVPDFSDESITNYMLSRDLVSEQIILFNDRLTFTTGAQEALQKGVAIPVGSTESSAYGTESSVHKSRPYVSVGTIYRQVRMVCELKLLRFSLPRYNLDDVPLGRHWKILLKRWMHQESEESDITDKLLRAHSCATQMEKNADTNPVNFWNAIVNDGNEFNFSHQATIGSTAKWMARNIIRFIDRQLRRKHLSNPTTGTAITRRHYNNYDKEVITVQPNIEEIADQTREEVFGWFRDLKIKRCRKQ